MHDWSFNSRSFGQSWGQPPFEAAFGVPAYQRQIDYPRVFMRRGLGAPPEQDKPFSFQDAAIVALVAAGFGGAVVWAVTPQEAKQRRSFYGAGVTGGLAAAGAGALLAVRGQIGQGAALLGLGALAALASWNAAQGD